ncbi:uncharacterized protein EV420DRAFT_1652254 [Desarmillaria tabescens]|uniref:Uncharacterized protein n=1 Tax=Armillaria tabescens TaxID=1929756 RepID=A0AA39J6D1_ARMTA|nr:uncharacterized protein EV420DRAFT_1652254 [Desarmillaria tabescens]KAK0436975.1 hypothetical protein EV420DRAFT_1652254 [Desarmillaria tabescens]
MSSSSMIPNGMTIQDNCDHLFYCVCSDTLPPILQVDHHGFEDPNMLWPSNPADFIDRCWASNAMPYQGFLPVHRESVFQCELFEPLNYTIQLIPVFSPSPGIWVVDDTVVDKWKNIEALFQCLRTVLDGTFVPNTNLGHIRFPLPWKYGYHHAKRSRKAMACTAMQSRDAFIIMAVEISYLLALGSSKLDVLPNTGRDQFPLWSAALTDKIGSNWVDLI